MRPLLRASRRLYSDKAYSSSLRLPNTAFPLRAPPSEREEPFRRRTADDLYKWQWENAKGPLFVFHDGPPYANGSLHMGHALNKVLKDIINRYHVLLGHRVHYVPGWDCHGLPIENKALQKLKTTHHSVPAEQIRKVAKETAEYEISVQKAEFRKLGVMADWDGEGGTYRTLDHKYEIRQLRVFQELVKKGLIYRQFRPVYYSPSSSSALAEAELVYVDNHASTSVYVAYECDRNALPADFLSHAGSKPINLLVWTTTPWTLPTNMAIAINPEMDYTLVKAHSTDAFYIVGTELLPSLSSILGELTPLTSTKGLTLLSHTPLYTPLFASPSGPARLPVIPSAHVTPSSGTGLVHTAPAHGLEDYHAFNAYLSLSNAKSKPLLCLVDQFGKFSGDTIASAGWLDEEVGSRLKGKKVLSEGGKEVIEILKERNALVGVEEIRHRYPYDWKTNKPVIVTATSQWFADLTKIKSEALERLKDVKFYPESARTRLESYISSRSEWCISRQRPWGVPIPSLHVRRRSSSSSDSTSTSTSQEPEKTILTPSSLTHILSVLSTHPSRTTHWWTGPVRDFVEPHLLIQYPETEWEWNKGTDTMDVWFDSGSSWVGVLDAVDSSGGVRLDGGDNGGDGVKTIADVVLEGSDQHRGWFQSLVLTAVGVSAPSLSSSSTQKKAEGEYETDSNGKKEGEEGNEGIPNLGSTRIRPYGTVITHGFVLDQAGRKMSKSVGNVISPMSIVDGGKDTKASPPHGASLLRLWAATIDYGKDTPLGPAVIQQTGETLRKIRNGARFMLGNVGKGCGVEEGWAPGVGDMSLGDRYMMYELYYLEKGAKEAYATYRFPQVVTALDRLAKVTLSSFYLDITKDALYADSLYAPQRKAAVWVMKEILETMKIVMAPILPHLSEEINEHLQKGKGNDETKLSVFTEGWRDIDEKWNDPAVERDMKTLFKVRTTVLNLLEQARTDKLVRSSLEAGVDIILPDGVDFVKPREVETLFEQESFLPTLFIVSDVSLGFPIDEGGAIDSPTWSVSETVDIEGSNGKMHICVRPAKAQKCPRCWTYTKEEGDLCGRCAEVLA
ncbi:hypothetical protein M422DRAFT_233237 [Sphaerobolus stellatus SS14]|uniref:isoleucine--tRNA ligase n=1 Tax=Sphaerobolus stellatus (strain SS14) TaxID=990650 RepID=A0A0C9VBX7_SPHS4|nr:hypothetical protein M422DRAFT_233237 [Sphaerobolus stellatus SS14]